MNNFRLHLCGNLRIVYDNVTWSHGGSKIFYQIEVSRDGLKTVAHWCNVWRAYQP